MYAENFDSEVISEAKELVVPKGYKILIAMPTVNQKTKGGILLPDDPRTREHTASIIGHVIAMGPMTFTDTERFPTGPWCAIGDTVLFRSYSGTRFKVAGSEQEFRLVNDDTIEAVVTDASKIERA